MPNVMVSPLTYLAIEYMFAPFFNSSYIVSVCRYDVVA